ncbi:MAG: hypothetical protein C5B59_12840 [Bacteroidetes bacterium]|nr:MAG: hypothetical protein C5B59_12840 [Bacteroidota bacterium]
MVIPTYTINDELEELAVVAALHYRDQVDELIITEDGGRLSKELFELSDVYLHNKHNAGFTRNVNRGWLLSTGDYTMIVNSDTKLLDGKLEDLCIPGKVTCPDVPTDFVTKMSGLFFCVPKEVKEKYGILNEEMKIYCSDAEYEGRVYDLIEKVPSVRIYHEQSKTCTAAGVNNDEILQRDREIFARLIKEGKAKQGDFKP